MNDNARCLIRYARLADIFVQPETCGWLQDEELRQYRQISDANRRRQWLAGRVVARSLLGDALGCDCGGANGAEIRILSRDDRGLGIAPRVFVDGKQIACGLSISHSTRGVLVGLVVDAQASLGVDLCSAVPMTAGFRRLWFAEHERAWIGNHCRRAATVWAVKEAVFKTLPAGTNWNPRAIEVITGDRLTFQGRHQQRSLDALEIRTGVVDGHVAAVACRGRKIDLSQNRWPQRRQNREFTPSSSVEAELI